MGASKALVKRNEGLLLQGVDLFNLGLPSEQGGLLEKTGKNMNALQSALERKERQLTKVKRELKTNNLQIAKNELSSEVRQLREAVRDQTNVFNGILEGVLAGVPGDNLEMKLIYLTQHGEA